MVGALTACPQDPLDEASRLEAEGKWKAAAEAYLARARSDPAHLAAWDGAVRIWCTEQVDVGRCLSVLDLELERLGPVPRHVDALAQALETRARSRMEQGLVQAALDDLARAERADPRRASVHAARARIALMRGDVDAARAAIEEARVLDPRLAELEELQRLTETEPSPPPFGR